MRKAIIGSVLIAALVWIGVAALYVLAGIFNDKRGCIEDKGVISGLFFCPIDDRPGSSIPSRWFDALQWPRRSDVKDADKEKIEVDPVTELLCFEVSQSLGAVMVVRQSGVPKEDAFVIFEGSPALKSAVDLAYQYSVKEEDQEKVEIAKEFAELFYKGCIAKERR